MIRGVIVNHTRPRPDAWFYPNGIYSRSPRMALWGWHWKIVAELALRDAKLRTAREISEMWKRTR